MRRAWRALRWGKQTLLPPIQQRDERPSQQDRSQYLLPQLPDTLVAEKIEVQIPLPVRARGFVLFWSGPGSTKAVDIRRQAWYTARSLFAICASAIARLCGSYVVRRPT